MWMIVAFLSADSQPKSISLVWGLAVTAESAFIKWTGWTLAMALRHGDSTTNIVVVLLLLLWICVFSSILQVGPTIPVAVSLEKHRYN